MIFWVAGGWEMSSSSCCPLQMWNKRSRSPNGYARPLRFHPEIGFIPLPSRSALRVIRGMAIQPKNCWKLQSWRSKNRKPRERIESRLPHRWGQPAFKYLCKDTYRNRWEDKSQRVALTSIFNLTEIVRI